MATGEQHSPLKSKKISSSSSQTRNDCDTQWLLIPNNLELGARAKPSKKQRNKEKQRFRKENLSSSSEIADGLSGKARSSFQSFPRVKSNTATWLKDQFANEEKSKRRAYDSEEVFSDSDFLQLHQQNVHYPANQTFPDIDHQEHQTSSRGGVENEKVRSVKDEFKVKEAAMVCDMLSNIQEFISEAESSWQKLDLTDEPIIKDAFVKLKNAVKDVEGGRENKQILHHMAAENGFANGVSPSSSTSRISNSKEIINRDSSGNTMLCIKDGDEQDKYNQLHEEKITDEKMESISSDDCVMADFGERVAAVEWERRKLKNKLVELQEEKKMKDELLRELYFLKDAANTVSASGDAQLQKSKDKKKKLYKLQSPSQHVKLTKGASSENSQTRTIDSDTPVSQPGSRHSRSSTSVKRDNVRKEQNSAFPARRHYEAEGRANEDPDIPVAPAPAISPALDNPEIQEKIRKLKVAQEHVKVIKDIVVSILETKSRALIPADQLRLLTPLQKIDFSDDESEDSELESEFPSVVHAISSEPAATNVKEIYCEGLKSSLDVECHKPEETEIVAENLETSLIKKEDLTKLQSQFHQLMQIFPPSSDRKNDDVRSSGEGAYTQKKNPSKNAAPENVQKIRTLRTVPHQDNLQLTRQNIVTMESQSQNSNSNLHNRDCSSVKKDNINNLSGKMGKLSIQNSMNSSYPDVLTASNNNMDTMSTFSYELNQNHSLPNEVERKTILDILKRDKKKQKQYDRNQDCQMCCNSSIDSEPLEGSNSALAIDTTIAAWGGSSTQENFEDENEEQAESLDEQDDEEESLSIFEKGSVGGHIPSTQYSGQFSNMQNFMESVTNISDKRQRNFQHSVYNRNQNQPVIQTGYQQHPAQPIKPRQPVSSPSATTGMRRDVRENPACVSDTAEHCQQHIPSKFFHQLKNHLDQLNSLCQNQIFNDRPQATLNSHPSQGYSHLPNACTPLQPAPEIPLPYNQQLLLCLSQCYHALYMQQLEIHHLQRCIWHNNDGENSQQPNNLNSRSNQEDSNFRPNCVPTWPNPFNPSTQFLPEQFSPLSSGAYFHLPMKSYANHSGSSYASGSGTQPARAVIHPTSQNNTPSQETLNNQVPPRTRANNFWDNFRSYSRQNLLSTSNNTKRNENVASLVTPQVRQVYPLVTNESPNRTTDISNTCCNTSSFSEYDRPALNPDDTATKNSRCNAFPIPASGSGSFQKKDVPTNVNACISRSVRSGRCHRMNLESSIVQPTLNSTSTNLIQPQPSVQVNSKLGSFASISPNSLSHSAPEASGINPTSEISSVLSSEHKSDFLIGLFHEAQALKSDSLRQKALRMIRELAKSERNDNGDISQEKIQNDPSHSLGELDRGNSSASNQRSSKILTDTATMLPEACDSEKTVSQVPSDNISGNIQNLPTAAILPLNKHGTPRTVSTGAVRKKPKILFACLSEPVSNGLSSSHDSSGSAAESTDPPTAMPHNKTIEDVPGFITEKVMSDLVSTLPFLKRRLFRDGCSQTFWTFINDCLIESLRTHLFFCNINLSRKSLVHLRQTVYLFLSLFSGMTLSDIDSDFVKYVEEFIYENVACFVASGQFAPVPSSLDEENCSLEIDSKIPELSIKMPEEPIEPNIKMSGRVQEESVDPVVLKMASEEAINFATQSGSISQQSLCTYDNFIPEPNAMYEHMSPEPEPKPVEDLKCDCNPEAEIEPEVEIGTEADLAEADQSPGQQGTVNDGLPAPDNWSLDHEAVLIHRGAGAALLMNGEDNRDIEDSSEDATGAKGLCPDSNLDQEAILDDIPTKLCASEEELPPQLKDEQPVPDLPSDDAILHNFGSESSGDGGPTILR